MHYGWEETTEMALALLLKTALSKSSKGAEGVLARGDWGGGVVGGSVGRGVAGG